MLAYSGTDETKDWVTNFGQGLGFETAQYNEAIALARQAKVAYGEDVIITGHSLGGGLAATAAIAADIPAVTFNASGVHDRTLERIGLDADAVKAEAEKGLDVYKRQQMLSRIYGTAWLNDKDLKAYLHQLEEAEKRDHRKIAKAQDLFHLQEDCLLYTSRCV